MRVAVECNGGYQAERQKETERQLRLANGKCDEERKTAKAGQKRHGHSNEPTEIETDRRAKDDLGVGGIERISWSGRPSAETIKAGDVAGIEVDKPETKGRTCTISIRLHAGQTFRSPTRHDEDGARALRAEIVRRLNIPSDIEKAR